MERGRGGGSSSSPALLPLVDVEERPGCSKQPKLGLLIDFFFFFLSVSLFTSVWLSSGSSGAGAAEPCGGLVSHAGFIFSSLI